MTSSTPAKLSESMILVAHSFDAKDGWVPVDASVGALSQRRDFNFGELDPHRVAFTLGRDLKLPSPQSGDPLNYMIFAYAERDGKIVSSTLDYEANF